MNTKEAVAKRIKELCNERNLKINGLANLFPFSDFGVIIISCPLTT